MRRSVCLLFTVPSRLTGSCQVTVCCLLMMITDEFKTAVTDFDPAAREFVSMSVCQSVYRGRPQVWQGGGGGGGGTWHGQGEPGGGMGVGPGQ